MKILILGNGAREKVIAEKLNNNNDVLIYNNERAEKIKNICIEKKIDLVIPSTEVYLCNGIVDYLQNEIENIKVFSSL